MNHLAPYQEHKARSKAQKRAIQKANRGRPKMEGDREPNGRLSRSRKPKEAMDLVALKARARHGRITIEQAKDQTAGTFVGILSILGTKNGGISKSQHKALERYSAVRADYLRAISAPGAGVASEGSGGGADISAAYITWCSTALQRFDEMKKAVRLEQEGNRTDNIWAAVDLCVHQDMHLWHMVGSLRVAANCLALHFGLDGQPRAR